MSEAKLHIVSLT